MPAWQDERTTGEEIGMAARRIQTGTTGSTTPSRRADRQAGTRRQTTAGEIADLPDFGDMFSGNAGMLQDDDMPATRTMTSGKAGTSDATRRRVPSVSRGSEVPSATIGRQNVTSIESAVPARRKAPTRGTRVTPSASAVSDIVFDDEKTGSDGFLGWYLDHQWVSFVISAASIAIGMMTNRYVSVVIAILLLGVGYLAEQQDVDDDAMATYVAAMLAFFVPFIY